MLNIITTNELTVTTGHTFKNPELEKATIEISNIYQSAVAYAEDKNREIAKILGRVKVGKLYTDDGFASVGEYAEKMFGIKKANAYALATAGEVYNDESASAELKAFTPSKLAELVKVDREKLEADVKAGTLDTKKTQKELREYAKAAIKGPDSAGTAPEVLEEYTIRVVGQSPVWLATSDENGNVYHAPLEDWEKRISYLMNVNTHHKRNAEVITVPKCATPGAPGDSKKKPVQRRLICTESTAVLVEFYTYKAPVPVMPSKDEIVSKYTREQLLNMLAAYDKAKEAEDSAAIAAEFEAAKQPRPVENPNANGVTIPGVNDVK